MYVVQMFDAYWLRDGDGQIDEIYDLEAATQFRTKKEAKEAIASTTFANHCEIKKFSEVLPEFLKWKERGMVRREIPKISEVSRPYNGEGLEEVIAFQKYHYTHEIEIRYEDWETWPDVNAFLYCFYNLVHYYSMDEDDEEGTISFQVMISKTNLFETFKRELNILLPHITHIDESGFAILPIFDHELSQYESRYFLYNTRGDKHKICNHMGRTLFTGSLRGCFDQIKQKYYYDD